MRKVKAIKRFVIYKLSEKEVKDYGFSYAPVLKETVECYGGCGIEPRDADMECETFEQAVSWAVNY